MLSAKRELINSLVVLKDIEVKRVQPLWIGETDQLSIEAEFYEGELDRMSDPELDRELVQATAYAGHNSQAIWVSRSHQPSAVHSSKVQKADFSFIAAATAIFVTNGDRDETVWLV